jgi:hypothetical protein
MAGRSYDLNKTWIPGQSRGTTVFNSSGNISIPYGRNKITVSGNATPGNPNTPSNPASYNGPSPASYNPTSGGNPSTYNAPVEQYYNPRTEQFYNAAGSPTVTFYNTIGCQTYNNPSGGTPAAPFTYVPGNCTQPTTGNCVSSYYYNAPSPFCTGVYNQPSTGNCQNFVTNCTQQPSVCNQYQPYGGNYAGCSSPNPAVPSFCNQYAGGTNNCTQYQPTCSGYNSPSSPVSAGYNPPTDIAWSEIWNYGGYLELKNSGYGGCPSPFIDDPYGFPYTYVYYACYPSGNTEYFTPGAPGTCIPGTPACTQFYYEPVYCAGNYNAYVPVGCDPGSITYNAVSQGPCVQYGAGPCTQFSTTCQYANPNTPGTCINSSNPGTCTTYNPAGCGASNPTTSYNNTYNQVISGTCQVPTGGNPQTYQPGAPSNAQTYNAGNPQTYNTPTTTTYNTLTPGNPLTYYPGGTPATYNSFVSGNPGPSTTVLGVYFPGGGAGSPAPYVSDISNYWNYPDGNTYPVVVTPQGQISIKIE